MIVILVVTLLLAFGVLAALVLVMVGIRTDERHMSLTGRPRTRVAAATRRLLNAGARGFHDDIPRPHDHARR
ncbi:MAG TPA: hypothetical protein VMV92_43535 [Streptosporangiaceae bacterium]|nr:hypothetical protein [Streptosporangiaceae bacterium]